MIAGFIDLSPRTDRPALAFAATIGVLAGLFTDQLIKKLREILGQTDFATAAANADETEKDADTK